jgi:hypothetical protein
MAMDKMFGSKGFELRRLAMDYKNIMASARRETEGLGALFADTGKFQSFERSMAKASLLAREIQMRLVNALPLEKIEEVLDKVDLDKFFDRLGVEFDEFMKAPESKFIEWGFKIGKAVGAGIIKGAVEFIASKEGVKTLTESFNVPAMIVRNLSGKGEVDTERRKTEDPVERTEREGKARLNWPLINSILQRLGIQSKPGSEGKTSSINKDILQEAKRSNVILKSIEDAAPTYG